MTSQEKKIAHIHPEVKTWISYIENDWRCSKGTAVQCLIKLIVTKLLTVELVNLNIANGKENTLPSTGQRTPASQTPSLFIAEALTGEPASTSQTSIPTITRTSTDELDTASQTTDRVIKRQLPRDLLGDKNYRVYAPEMRQGLEDILTLLECGQIEPIGNNILDGKPPPPGPSRPQLIIRDGHLGVSNTRVG
jgi:hypothetical protein